MKLLCFREQMWPYSVSPSPTSQIYSAMGPLAPPSGDRNNTADPNGHDSGSFHVAKNWKRNI